MTNQTRIPSGFDYLLYIPVALFCAAGLIGVFDFNAPILLAIGLIYALLELSRIPIYLLHAARGAVMLIIASTIGIRIFLMGGTPLDYLLFAFLIGSGLWKILLCLARLPQRIFAPLARDSARIPHIPNDTFISDGSIRKIGVIGGLDSLNQPIMLYEAQKKAHSLHHGRA